MSLEIVRKDDTPRAAPEERKTFTRLVGMTPLLSVDDKALVRVAHVSFEPGARTYWHTHPAGQILYVTKGTGLIQTWDERNEGKKAAVIRPDDVIYIPPGEKHWHGASPNAPMEHVAHSMGGNTEWLEEVSEADYTNAS